MTTRSAASRANEDELASTVLLALHRLIKQSTLYEEHNDAQTRQIEMTQKAISEYGRRVGRNPKLYFTEKSIFVGRKLQEMEMQLVQAAVTGGVSAV